jgi:leucyl-tRNA synthetase
MYTRRANSIIEELDRFVPQANKQQIIEARANNVIASAMNLLTLINECFTPEEAEELHKRLLGAIKNQDPEKFNRKIREFRNAKGD